MDKVQEKHFSLLCEIDDICAAAKIPYFLIGRSALLAYVCHAVPGADTSPSVAIRVRDIGRFKQEFERRNMRNRMLESMETSPLYPNFTMRYINTDSLCLNVRQRDNYQAPGLHVQISFIEFVPERTNKRLANAIKRAWIEHCWPYGNPDALSSSVAKAKQLVNPYISMKGDGASAVLYKRLVDIYSKKSKSYQMDYKTLESLQLPSSWIESRPYGAVVNDRLFPLFSDPDMYLRTVFGTLYLEKAHTPRQKSAYRIVDVDVPFEQFKRDNPDLFELDLRSIVTENDKLNRKNQSPNSKMVNGWRLALYVGRTMDLEKRYKRDRLLLDNLWDNGAYDELYDMLQEYVANAIYRREGAEPFYDKHLYELCEKALEELDKANQADNANPGEDYNRNIVSYRARFSKARRRQEKRIDN